jgi:glycosyltransferase involved in cell wall biosynthesis
MAFIGKIRGRKVVYDSHELATEVAALRNRPVRKWFWTQWEKISIPLCSGVVTVSDEIAAVLRKKYSGPSPFVQPNVPPVFHLGAPRDFFADVSLAAGKTRLLMQGDLRPHSGVEQILSALRDLPDFCLLILGDGIFRQPLEQLAATCGLQDRVHFAGQIPLTALPAATASGHIGLNCYLGIGQSLRLTIANKFFDYVQAGLPVVTSDFPPYRRLFQEFPCGVLVDPHTPAAIRRGILEVKEKNEYYRSQCKKARAVWNWNHTQPEYMAYLTPFIKS